MYLFQRTAATFIKQICLIHQNQINMNIKLFIFSATSILLTGICKAQDTLVNNELHYDPHLHKLIPDKVYEFGIPILFLYLLLNTIVNILKNRADQQLKLKMLEKGVSENTLIQIFKESNTILKLQPLKYFLLCFSLGISLVTIHFCKDYLTNQSGYFAIGIILLFTSVAFFMYYRILQNKI
jgi:hypothetical protein